MLGALSYEELKKLSDNLDSSSNNIREVIEKYGDSMNEVLEFCNRIEAYSKFINSNISLNQDADTALLYMINKNK